MRRREFLAAGALLPLGAAAGAQPPVDARGRLVYFGTYTGTTGSKGIYVSRFDTATGALTPPALAAESVSPSFLAAHPARDVLYAVNEIDEFGGAKAGSVSAFAIDRATGRLTLLDQQPSGGPGPAHLTVDPSGRTVLVANYGGGSVAALPVGGDGRAQPPATVIQHAGRSIDRQRQNEPHAHSVATDAEGRFVYAADLGLDQILIYRLDASSGRLLRNDPPLASVTPGSGPRHFAIHPGGRFAYVINELTCTVTAFARDTATGGLTGIHTVSTLPEGQAVAPGFSTAEVLVHPSGRFLYGSNRGHDSIAVFRLDEGSGRLAPVQHEPTQGRTPRNFGISPDGAFLLAANQRSNSVVVFRIDGRTGLLSPAGHRVDVPSPVCVKFLP